MARLTQKLAEMEKQTQIKGNGAGRGRPDIRTSGPRPVTMPARL